MIPPTTNRTVPALALASLAFATACRAPRPEPEFRSLIADHPDSVSVTSPAGGLLFGGWLVVEPEPAAQPALARAQRLERRAGRVEAIAAITTASRAHPECATLFVARGALHVAAGFPRAGAADFEHALTLAPDCSLTWFALGHAYELLQLSRLSLAALERARDLGCREPRLWLALARAQRSPAVVSGAGEGRCGTGWRRGTHAPGADGPPPASAASSAAGPR